MHFKAYFNRDGGTFRTIDMPAYVQKAEQVFRDAGHEIECHVIGGKEIVRAIEKGASEQGTEGLIAGGGDGTISTAAGIAWKADLPLGIVPAGTMNLFARSLKLPLDIWAVLDVLARGRVEHVDIGTADGRPFVHQFSAGMHARMVRLRDAMTYASRFGKIAANVRASVGVVLDPPQFEVEFDVDGHREHRMVSAVSVSNNPRGNNSLLFSEEINTGELGFYLTDALRPAGAAKLAIDILRGRMRQNTAITEMRARSVDLHFPKLYRKANCVLDGELMPLGRNVSLRLHAGALKVIVPENIPVMP
ncbi:diacylglycerol/lipid kinase family protein [Rhizobium sp. LjRoot254]|uniref:diacylglycerol/lipid kinase family protein n=1 Tax=Rhizobium sp. LjRoot254 TaxID=3342297 RepID=UPI003ED04F5A